MAQATICFLSEPILSLGIGEQFGVPYSFEERLQKLKEIWVGWVNNYRLASIHAKLKQIDEWLRNWLRYCIWHDWKKPERKRKNLIRLGVPENQAYAWSRTRMGGWAVAQSPILGTTINLARLRRKGYESMLDYSGTSIIDNTHQNFFKPWIFLIGHNEVIYMRPISVEKLICF